jgi:hypothetical protein
MHTPEKAKKKVHTFQGAKKISVHTCYEHTVCTLCTLVHQAFR